MIEFKQKEFWGIALSTGATMLQGGAQNKKNMAQQEEFQNQQAKLQKKQNEALNKIAKAAENDPSKAQAAAGVLQQKAYASPSAFLKKGGQVVYNFAKGIGGHNIARKVGGGLAMGAAMAGGSYVIDKAIQADRARITGGAPLPVPQKSPEEKKQERKKKLIKAGVGTALAAGSVLAARRGLLGQGLQNISRGKFNSKALLGTAKESFKKGMTGKELAVGAGFAGIFTVPGYIGERSQLKKQAKAQAAQEAQQQKQFSVEQEQKEQPKKKGSVLKKAVIGTAATAAGLATLRRVGPVGIRKSINNMYMTYGNKLAGKAGNGKIGNWMMKSGAKEYGKAQAKFTENFIQSKISQAASATNELADAKALDKLKNGIYKYDPKGYANHIKNLKKSADPTTVARMKNRLANFDSAKFAEEAGKNHLAKIRSSNKLVARQAQRKVGEGLIGGYGTLMGVGPKETTGFLRKMSRSGDTATAKTADWLLRHKRAGLLGGAVAGSIAFKPFGWGDAAAKKAIGAVDKNAFAYEKSKEQQVPAEE